MDIKTTQSYYNALSVLCGLWFLITGWIWVYYVNLVIGYPIALIGILLWKKGRQTDPANKLNKAALIIHMLAFGISLIALILLLSNN
jgi:hypothetical protein